MNHVQSPDNSDPSIEREIQAKGKTAARVTPADVKAEIVGEFYFTAGSAVAESNSLLPTAETFQAIEALDLLTFCVLVLHNGYTVTGESACASPENFDAEIGRRIARDKAVDKVWPLLGFRLRDKISAEAARRPDPAPGDEDDLPF